MDVQGMMPAPMNLGYSSSNSATIRKVKNGYIVTYFHPLFGQQELIANDWDEAQDILKKAVGDIYVQGK